MSEIERFILKNYQVLLLNLSTSTPETTDVKLVCSAKKTRLGSAAGTGKNNTFALPMPSGATFFLFVYFHAKITRHRVRHLENNYSTFGSSLARQTSDALILTLPLQTVSILGRRKKKKKRKKESFSTLARHHSAHSDFCGTDEILQWPRFHGDDVIADVAGEALNS